MALFPPDRALLYPQFETYRLHSLSPTEDVQGHRLPGSGTTQSRLEHGQHTLSFKETRDRIGWDHLAVNEQGRGIYVDKEWNIVGFELDDNLIPSFSVLATLPTPISSSSAPAPEYPSTIAIHPNLWAISSGAGDLHLLCTSDPTSSCTLSSTFTLSGGSGGPFLIRAARAESDSISLLLSRSVIGPEEGKSRTTKRTFELLEVVIDLSSAEHTSELDVRWRIQAGDLPVYTAWTDAGWMVLSGETYGNSKTEEALNEVEKEKRERDARIAKLGLGASLPQGEQSVPVPPSEPARISTPPPDQPLTWTQTGESASIRIPFAAGTVRSDIVISLHPTSINLSVKGVPAAAQPEPLQQFLRHTERSWWAEIDPDLSSFSYDSSSSTLDIDLAKQDGEHRWPSLFLPSSDDDDAEIPETLSSDVLASVRQTFDSIRTRAPDEPAGNHPAIPSLLREEMDFDMEDGEDFEDRAAGAMGDGGGKVGREVFVGILRDGKAEWSTASVTVVSLPLQSGGRGNGMEGVIVKSAVDGLLFTPSADLVGSPWTHQATIPALAFVLSSKRDIRLVRHLTPLHDPAAPPSPKKAKTDLDTAQHPTVLAFDSGSSSAGQGNVYVYYPPTGKTTSKQGVVRVSGLERGAALGVARIRKNGKDVVLVLCEKELVVLSGVL
ncbi:uncharacterized protein MKK02DRAFT_39884 [Dioszegia hungarica]|uniref:NudC domain-containing protein 1 n=1 Tax=Dioszegia hungarica TaxID=4972 RepID=A0AA38LY72_9TREE|nr:uncharacterized protein MKK02DRAFT_39884 [Dioszegia hungarica]KAI9639568.1 hypothetical protein MKK02DRAFT_39884 [Dioszegia hungarica]